MGLPIHVYPLYENARRAHRGQSAAENGIESANMYAKFDKIGTENEYSWNYQQPPKTAEQIGLPSKRNRMICDPCTASGSFINPLDSPTNIRLRSASHERFQRR